MMNKLTEEHNAIHSLVQAIQSIRPAWKLNMLKIECMVSEFEIARIIRSLPEESESEREALVVVYEALRKEHLN